MSVTSSPDSAPPEPSALFTVTLREVSSSMRWRRTRTSRRSATARSPFYRIETVFWLHWSRSEKHIKNNSPFATIALPRLYPHCATQRSHLKTWISRVCLWNWSKWDYFISQSYQGPGRIRSGVQFEINSDSMSFKSLNSRQRLHFKVSWLSQRKQ